MRNSEVKGVVTFRIDIAGHSQVVYVYVIPNLDFLLILGNPWKAHNKIRTAPEKRRFYHGRVD
jgi:hypothetical protein